jgi:hypothetical protein
VDENQFQKILEEVARLKIVEQRFLEDFIGKGKSRFVRELVVSNKLEEMFIELFVSNEQICFTEDNLQSLMLLIRRECPEKAKVFAIALLQRCRAEQSKNSRFLFSKLGVLVDGLRRFHEELFHEIDGILPGLNFFLLMKTGNRRKVLYLLGSNPHFQLLKNKNVPLLLCSCSICSWKTSSTRLIQGLTTT